MTKVQTILAPNGDEMVVISRAEYDALVAAATEADEDAADAAMFDERIAELAAGSAEALPVEVSAAVLNGSTRMKAIRKWRGVSQVELAERTGLGQGYLSDIENGRRKAEAAVAKIAAALDVPIAWLD